MYSDDESSTVHGGVSSNCSGLASIRLGRIEQGEAKGIADCGHSRPEHRHRQELSRLSTSWTVWWLSTSWTTNVGIGAMRPKLGFGHSRHVASGGGRTR